MSEDSKLEGLRAWTHVIYALHAWSVLAGILSSAFIVTAFLLGWPSIIGVILNYIKRSDTVGTLYESHFRWQIRTFWFAVPWALIAVLLLMTGIGAIIALPMFGILGIWVMYRVLRGWIALAGSKPMPLPKT